LAVWMMASTGVAAERTPSPWTGALLLAAATAIRVAGGTAVGLTAARIALLLACTGLILFFGGRAQLRQWWLPLIVLALCIPIPDFLLGEITIPLQLRASKLGAALLEWRGVPVQLTGNVIRLPGHELFVTEACSGLRSLSSLVSLAVLLCGTGLQTAWTRVLLLVGAIAIAILVNGVRVFLTGFLVVFVDPSLGEGFMHTTEGLLLFLVSTALLLGLGAVLAMFERRVSGLGRAVTAHA
jgi:exosortase